MSYDRLDKEKTDRFRTPMVKCSECLKEIPQSEAFVREAADYTLYFCGIECFDKWRAEKPDEGAGADQEMEHQSRR
jgi:hypothetical protein